jgi:hypothetical protein
MRKLRNNPITVESIRKSIFLAHGMHSNQHRLGIRYVDKGGATHHRKTTN